MTPTTQTRDPDSIERYLATETVPLDPNNDGSLLSYWNVMLKTQPRVARMALNYLTAPATSVDAERAFSGGRLMINHLQHRMSSETFQAKMAIGSWFGTPLLPDALQVSRMIEKTM
ncbi:hypothetical protein FRC08_004087 [Ceratobasidium sp. 394]|nr:hypothetical protein FRC08_004087 [Ceratobasidium sp. 394]